MCWRVADIDATHARLVAAGIDVSEVRTGRKPGTRVMTVRNGTCGVPTLLVQPSAQMPPRHRRPATLVLKLAAMRAKADPVRSWRIDLQRLIWQRQNAS